MADIELVIKLDEEIYNHTQKYEVGGFNRENDTKLFMAIKNGTPLPKGHWIDNTDLGYHVSICSNCSWRGHGDTNLIYKPKFCPNCGADMRGEQV